MKKIIFTFLPIFVFIGAVYSIVFKFQNLYGYLFFLSDFVLILTSLGLYLYCNKDKNAGLIILFISVISFWILGSLKLFALILVILMSFVIFYSIYLKLCYVRYEKMERKTYVGSKLEFIDNNRYKIYAVIIILYIILKNLVKGIAYGFDIFHIIGEIPFLLMLIAVIFESYKNGKITLIVSFIALALAWGLWYYGILNLIPVFIITAGIVYVFITEIKNKK